MIDDAGLLAIDAATLFLLDRRGRILKRGEPDGGPGSRLWLASCRGGQLARFGVDVTEEAVAAIAERVAGEPAFAGEARAPLHLASYLEILAPAPQWSHGPIYILPPAPAFAHEATLILSGTGPGEALRRRLAQVGMPAGLRDLGFKDVADLWDPWCAALEAGEPASVCFAARLSPKAAEAGVATAVAHRGKGLAAAATAGWAAHPHLAGRILFYSTWADNHSSRKVAERLGLRLLGASFSIT